MMKRKENKQLNDEKLDSILDKSNDETWKKETSVISYAKQ